MSQSYVTPVVGGKYINLELRHITSIRVSYLRRASSESSHFGPFQRITYSSPFLFMHKTNQSGSILPALAFSLDMFSKTAMSFGVNEVLLSSVLGSVVFSVFAAQPLVIVGVTGTQCSYHNLEVTADRSIGPITVFNYTVYDIITPRGTNYFAFMCWIGLYVSQVLQYCKH
jgi:hypothetical protein